nr:unnamed protein product [Digitaria exilis]
MLASRVRLLLGVLPANHGILLLPRGLTPHASSPWHGGAARRYDHQLQQQQEEWEESKAVRVTVWWDIHSCRLPPRVIPGRLGPRVTEALRRAGIRGPVEITAFGDVTSIPLAEQEALNDTGVALSHLPSGCVLCRKDECNQLHISDVVSWIAQNPPPAHFLLISGDEHFANVLHRLRMSNYNVLLSCPSDGSKILHSAATLMWPWEPLVNGVSLVPKYLNQPPDGLSSWYGQYKGSGDDLLLKPKNHMALPRNAMEPEVPKSVVNGIKKVLHFYPEGVRVSTLRKELRRINVCMDGFHSLRKFSALLRAMPDVVKFLDPLPGDNRPTVVQVFKGPVESSEQSNFNRMDSAQSSIEEKHHNVSESEELPSLNDQPSSSESPSPTGKKTQETGVRLSPLEQLSRDQRTVPGLAQQAEPPSHHVEADVTLAGDVPSPPSHAPSIDQRNAAAVDLIKKTERPVNHVEAEKVDTAGTPSSSGAQGDISNKKGLFERVSSLWNWSGRSA